MTAVRIPLGELAVARAGDKGDTSILAVFPRAGVTAQELRERLDVEAIARHFGMPQNAVATHEGPGVDGFVLVLTGRLSGGVTRSTTTDPHGKSLSYHLLELPVAPLDESVSGAQRSPSR